MALNFRDIVYAPNYNVFARSIWITPVVSQPGMGVFNARGIFDTRDTDVVAMDGSLFSDCKTILDILIDEFPVVPLQGDIVDIPFEAGIEGGVFYISDRLGEGNAGGELTLVLQRKEDAKPGRLAYIRTTEAPDVASFIQPLTRKAVIMGYENADLASLHATVGP
jgi:hypothetical protein